MIDHSFKELVRILTKIDANICLLMPYKCTNFQLDRSTHLRVRADFVICAKRRRRIKTETLVSRILEMLGTIYYNLESCLPLQAGRSTANLVIFV